MRRTLVALGAAVSALAVVGVRGQDDALLAMAATERAFARMSVETGQREAFLAFFAPEGVVFNPAPVNAADVYRQRPPTPRPQVRILDWEPAVGDVAISEDLGFSTGPFVLQDAVKGTRLAGGWFFSIWTRRPDGTWRVVVDLGVRADDVVPLRPRTVERATPPDVQGAPAGTGESGLDAVRAIDASFSERSAAGDVKAYLARATERTRVYRAGRQPAVGPDAIRALLEKEPPPSCRAVQGGISAAGDFAYVYGTFEATPAGANAPQQGGFVRVWRRVRGGWALAAEVLA